MNQFFLLSDSSLERIRRNLELIQKITPGNCSHLAGNIRVMLDAVLTDIKNNLEQANDLDFIKD